MKHELNEIKREQQNTNERLDRIDSKQYIIYEQTGKLSEYHTETLSQLDNLAAKDDLEYFDKKITEHDRKIYKMKNRA